MRTAPASWRTLAAALGVGVGTVRRAYEGRPNGREMGGSRPQFEPRICSRCRDGLSTPSAAERRACRKGGIKRMKLIFFLLVLSLNSLQAEVNAAEEMFTKAVRDGDPKTIETILSIGFHPNQPLHGYTALYFAVQASRIDAVELLLAAHADPNALVMSGMNFSQYGGNVTPLQLAVLLDNVRLASKLIKAGAHINGKGTTGRTALQYAVRD